MEKERRIIIGTIGHVNHGKTTLTAAITHVLTEQGSVGTSKPKNGDRLNPYATSMYEEYELIMQKKSKLNHNERKYIVSCVESKTK